MISIDSNQFQQILSIFKAEVDDHLQKLNNDLLLLEKEDDKTQRQFLLEEIFREVHNLKGAARAVDFRLVEEISHKLETLLDSMKKNLFELTPALVNVIYCSFDIIDRIVKLKLDGVEISSEKLNIDKLIKTLENASEGKIEKINIDECDIRKTQSKPKNKNNNKKTKAKADTGNKQESVQPPKKEKKKLPQHQVIETIRVHTPKLNNLLARASELMEKKIETEQRVVEIKEIRTEIETLNKEGFRNRQMINRYINEVKDNHIIAMLQQVNSYHNKLKRLSGRIDEYYRKFSSDIKGLSSITRDLQEEIKQVRMLPISLILNPFKRMVRDLALATNKKINLQFNGIETEVDKKILEELKDPLTHLFRNAIDHGIESVEQRKNKQKPETGTIKFSVFQKGNQLILEIFDDGAGIDYDKIKQEALNQNIITAEDLVELKNNDIINLIFKSGFSTNSIITDLSGRGIGLDVVRKKIEKLHGVIHVESEHDKHTKFTMSLPISLATLQCILIVVGGKKFAIPTLAVERIIRIPYSDIKSVSGREMIEVEGRPVTVFPISKALGLLDSEKFSAQDKIFLIIININGKRIAYIVDSLIGNQELVIKPLGQQLVRIRNIAAASILGDGQIVLMLNVPDLFRSVSKLSNSRLVKAGKENIETKKRILVVDDSITTRTMEKSILEMAGYDVRTANDGEEGLRYVKENQFDAVVTDVQMPNMDGFEFTQAIKRDNDFKELPVILVTSLESKEDKERGIEVGADAYIVKKNFDQTNLLDTLKQLV